MSRLTELYNWCSDRITNDNVLELIVAQPPDGTDGNDVVNYSSKNKGESKSIHSSPTRDVSPNNRIPDSNVMLTSVGTRIMQQNEQPSLKAFVLSKHKISRSIMEEQSSTSTTSISFSSCSFDSISSCFNPCIYDADIDEGENVNVHPLFTDRRAEKLLKGKGKKLDDSKSKKTQKKKKKKSRSKSLDFRFYSGDRTRLSRIENDCNYDDDDNNDDAVTANIKRKHNRSLKSSATGSLPPDIEHSEIITLTSLADDDISELTYT